MKPEVSVVIPTYNSEKYITQALKSVFAQSYNNLEVILIDDASDDATVSIAQSFPDRRLKIIINKQNQGVSFNRNLGIRQAKGKWIALLDSDDWYAPLRLEKLTAAGEIQNADLIADDLFLINENQRQHWSTLLAECSQIELSQIALIDAVKFVTSDRLSSINAKRSWSLGYVKPLMKRKFLLENQIWYDENLNAGEDFSLYLECLRQQARFYVVKQPYYYYRTRTISLSTRKPTEYLAESCAITRSFIKREINAQTESRLLKTLLSNLAIFQKRLAYYHLLESIKDKKFLRAITQVLDNPYLISDLSQKSLMVLLKKSRALLMPKAKTVSEKPPSYPDWKELLQVLKI